MQKIVGIVVIVSLLAICASSAIASWLESFESYSPGVALSSTNSAWTGGHLPGSSTVVGPTNSMIGAGTGYSASQGWYAPVHTRGRAYRIPDAGDVVLFFRYRFTQPPDITYSRDMHVFMTTDDEYETTYGSSVTGPSVGAEFYWESWSVVSRFGYTGNKQVRYLQTNTWYDVKMTLLNSSTVEYAYKRSEDTEWTTLTGDIPTGFSYNYVNLESGSWFRSDLPPVYVDDIASFPVSSSAFLTGKVTLQDYEGDPGLAPVKIEMVPQGGGSATSRLVFLQSGGNYSTDVAAGTYDITFSAARFLPETVTDVVIPEFQTVQADLCLRNGNMNGIGGLDAADINIILPNLDAKGD